MRQVCLFILFAGLCHGVSKATECTARGRFPNNEVEDCRGYTMCILGPNSYTQYKLPCPVGFVYSHLENQCTNATNYQCMPSFVCNTTGNFESRLSKNCLSYIACPEGIDGIATARQVECPLGKVFNPLETACVDSTEYECSVDVTQKAVTDSFTEEPVLNNSTNFSVQVTGGNEFHLASDVSVNSAVDVCSRHGLMFAFLILVNVH